MNGLLVAATEMEIWPVMRHIKKAKNWDTLITGIGGMAATYHILKAVTRQRPDIILQAGLAGRFKKDLALGSVAVVEADFLGDLGVVEHKLRKSVFDLNLVQKDKKPFKDGWLQNPYRRLMKQTNLPLVSAVTVNEISTHKDDISFYSNHLKAELESMEGAALHYVALQEKIPFLQIRSISNDVGERNKQKWKMKEAIENLNLVLTNYIIHHY